MNRKLILATTAVLASVGAGTFALAQGTTASAGTPKFDNSTDTVNCSTFLGKATVSPALALGGSSPTTITVKGKLFGCADATGHVSGSSTSQTPFSGSVSGTLTGTSNNISTLAGCSNASGSLVVKFKGYYLGASPAEKLLYTSTTINIHQIYGGLFAPGAPFGQHNVTTTGYGSFEIGANATADGGCTAPTVSGTAAFGGSDNGASTASVAVTSQDISAILGGQANANGATTLTLGIGAYYGG
jgi:hypothetical protein